MRSYIYGTLCAVLVSTAACNGPDGAKKKDTTLTDTTMVNAGLPDHDNLSQVISSYISLKNELVKSDVDAARNAADKLKQDLADVKGCAEAANMADAIASSNDIKAQRKAFLTLSNDIIPLAKGTKTGDVSYVAYCPMANNGKGGYWLSEVKEIRNPYYGDDMLQCGEVKETLQ